MSLWEVRLLTANGYIHVVYLAGGLSRQEAIAEAVTRAETEFKTSFEVHSAERAEFNGG